MAVAVQERQELLSIGNINTVNDLTGYTVQEMMHTPKGSGTWWTELIHGGRHITHVVREAEAMIEKCGFTGDSATAIMIMAWGHDLGRIGDAGYSGLSAEELAKAVDVARIDPKNPKYIDHAVLSSELIKRMSLGSISPELKDDIIWAVRRHSTGLPGEKIVYAETRRELLLGLLVVLDHCGDAASPDGSARAIKALSGKPVLSSIHKAGYLRQYVGKGLPIVSVETPSGTRYKVADDFPVIPIEQMAAHKNESIVAHLIYNLQASLPILACVWHLLSERYIEEEVKPRQNMYEATFLPLLILQERSEALGNAILKTMSLVSGSHPGGELEEAMNGLFDPAATIVKI